MAASKGFWLKQVCNAALVGAVAFVVGGYYDKAADWKAHRVLVAVDPGHDVQSAAAGLKDEDFRQIDCLARNMYFEARSQGQEGMKAVSDVVFNRLKSGLFPDSVCQIITQCSPTSGVCQFSWFHDGRDHAIRDKAAWDLAYTIAYNEWLYHEKMPDSTGGATRYHATYVSPAWGGWNQTVQIGLHRFFKPKAPQS
jgi:spore germination cell wall hydrolase CwlJ-like protein